MIVRTASFAALAAVALVASARPAHACGPPICFPAEAAPAGGIPASTPAVPYRASKNNGGSAATQTFKLLTPGIGETPTTLADDAWSPGGELLVPNAPLAAGIGYMLAYNETCGTATDVKRTFDTSANVTLPAAAGTVSAASRVVGKRSVGTVSGSCTTEVEAVSFDIVVKPSMELLAYRNVTGFNVSIDGAVARSIYYGVALVKDGSLVVTSLHAACGTRNVSDDNGPALGIHTVSVQAHVAGAATDPPALAVPVNFSCTDDTVPPNDVDAGTTVPISAPVDAGTSTSSSGSGAAPAPNAGEPEDSGCATSPRAKGTFASAFGGLALVAALVVLRSRRRTR